MREIQSIKDEFEKDYYNEKLTNKTLEVKYLKSIIADTFKEEGLTEETVNKYKNLEDDLSKRIKERNDFKQDIQEKLIKLQEDVTRGYREFEVDNLGPVVVKFPGILDDEKIELECSRLYNILLQDREMLTEKEILDILERRGIWGDEQEKRLAMAVEEYQDIQFRLNSEKVKDKPKMKKVESITKEAREMETVIQELNSIKSKHVLNSIESRVEEVRQRTKLACCVYSVDKDEEGNAIPGERLWDSTEKLTKENKAVVLDVFTKANLYWSGLDPAFLDSPL